MSLRRSFAAAFAVASLSLAASAWASPYALKPGEFYSELSGNLFSTDTYFDNANEKRVPLGGTLEQRALRFHNELGWKKRASVYLDVPIVSRTFVPATGGSATSTGLGDIGLGVRYGMHMGKTPLALTVGWTAPLGSNRRLFPGVTGGNALDGTRYGVAVSPNGQTASFFDAGMQSLSAQLAFGGPLGKRAFYSLGGGYRSAFLTIGARDSSDRYADHVLGDASLGIWMTSHLLVTGTFHAEWAASQGETWDRLSAPIVGANGPELESNAMLAGARFTYRIDDKMDVFAGSVHTPSGRNVLHADHFYAGIAFKQSALDKLAGAFGTTKSH
ncbi:MAG: hypothetical protein K8R56_06595 [Candidatus Eisenbacteria bacterium]|nr:hypothetical protein [Candidatus Eisenbacteria bacterium]